MHPLRTHSQHSPFIHLLIRCLCHFDILPVAALHLLRTCSAPLQAAAAVEGIAQGALGTTMTAEVEAVSSQPEPFAPLRPSLDSPLHFRRRCRPHTRSAQRMSWCCSWPSESRGWGCSPSTRHPSYAHHAGSRWSCTTSN
eukprot:scaffold137586_cov105-Phaeocystis_antarctica.AAC.1